MIRSGIAILFLIILYEGFSLLPESMIVVPGVFRIRDAYLLFLPVFFVLSSFCLFRIIKNYQTESKLVLAITAMVFLGPLMARFFFGQPYFTGLMVFRHSLVWLSFFIFIVVLRDLENTERFLGYFTLFIGVWLILIILTKYLPSLGVIQVSKGYYGEGHMKRFGEYRLFFPYGSVPIYLYCFSLAKLLHGSKENRITAKFVSFGFVFLTFFAVTSTFTRILIISLLLVTLYALATCKRQALRLLAFSVGGLLIVIQAFSMAAGTSGIGLIEQSNLGRVALQFDKLEKEEGRVMQLKMNFNNFLRSPIVGVGNLVSAKANSYELESAPLMRAYRQYGFYNATDTGYPKMAAENGLLGLAWVIWYFRYVFSRSRDVIIRSNMMPISPAAKVIGYGTLYFSIYLLISGVTLAHFITPDGIAIIALALAILAITRKSLDQRKPLTASKSAA